MKKIVFLSIQICLTFIAFTLNAQAVVKYTSANLNLREKPNAKSDVLIVLPKGTEIKVEKFNPNTWVLISHNGNVGYVHSKYLTDKKQQFAKFSTPSGAVKYYTNSRGERVQSPTHYNSIPAGATARCVDGTYSFSKSRRGTCSGHGGVAQWL